jgi:hypothetical protein
MDVILIKECPHCLKNHLYGLNVSRSYWQGLFYVPARPKEFIRLFTCPQTNEDFQVEMHLIQPHGEDYEEISIVGAIEAEIDLEEDLQVPPGGIEYKDMRILGIF